MEMQFSCAPVRVAVGNALQHLIQVVLHTSKHVQYACHPASNVVQAYFTRLDQPVICTKGWVRVHLRLQIYIKVLEDEIPPATAVHNIFKPGCVQDMVVRSTLCIAVCRPEALPDDVVMIQLLQQRNSSNA